MTHPLRAAASPSALAPSRLLRLSWLLAAAGCLWVAGPQRIHAADAPATGDKARAVEIKPDMRAEVRSEGAATAPLSERIREGLDKAGARSRTAPAATPTVQVQVPTARPPGSLPNPVDSRPRRVAAPSVGKAVAMAEAAPVLAGSKSSREELRARAAAMAGHGPMEADGAMQESSVPHEVHWEYEGINGPQAWGRLQPEFSTCSLGRRQSPIHIQDADALQGPAEPLQLRYQPSGGSVVHNGHTLQVDLEGDLNTLTVRGSTYRLVQFHFHHPAEEKVNYKGFSMVAHLVHRNEDNQLAVLAVLLDPGEPNALIQRVWTHMPLDVNDRVQIPSGSMDLNALLPQDRRYYQFMGSLTTPPCTEGVLWMVMKAPMTVGADQLRLFARLFPHNARPTQPLNGRVVRDAQ